MWKATKYNKQTQTCMTLSGCISSLRMELDQLNRVVHGIQEGVVEGQVQEEDYEQLKEIRIKLQGIEDFVSGGKCSFFSYKNIVHLLFCFIVETSLNDVHGSHLLVRAFPFFFITEPCYGQAAPVKRPVVPALKKAVSINNKTTVASTITPTTDATTKNNKNKRKASVEIISPMPQKKVKRTSQKKMKTKATCTVTSSSVAVHEEEDDMSDFVIPKRSKKQKKAASKASSSSVAKESSKASASLTGGQLKVDKFLHKTAHVDASKPSTDAADVVATAVAVATITTPADNPAGTLIATCSATSGPETAADVVGLSTTIPTTDKENKVISLGKIPKPTKKEDKEEVVIPVSTPKPTPTAATAAATKAAAIPTTADKENIVKPLANPKSMKEEEPGVLEDKQS